MAKKTEFGAWLFQPKGRARSMKTISLYLKDGCKAVGLALGVLAVMGLLGGSAFAQSKKPKQTGTISINQVQVAFIFSGNVGGGKLHYKGKTYPFTIGGLGVGGIGVSSIEATGEVYDLKKLSDFDGAYGQARSGVVLGNKSAGSLWLENTDGVYLHLKAKRAGVMLSLGVDGIYIDFD
jgi:hypothetical protein